MGAQLLLILTALIVNCESTYVRGLNQTAHKFQNLFDSISKNETRHGEIYHGILKQEEAKERLAFDAMKEELEITRNRNAYKKKNFYKTIDDRTFVATKREIKNNCDTTVKKIEVSTEWWTGIYENNKTITYEGIISLFRAKTGYVIDVRTRKEINETGLIIPSSVNIPLNELQDALNLSYQDFPLKYGRDKAGLHSTVIFVCRSGRRSALAVRVASAMGYTNPYNYVGGLLDWEKHKLAENEMNINWPWWDGPK